MTARKRAAAKRRPSAKAPADMERVPQPHGGALLKGGVKGNRGGSAPPPSAVRRAALLSFEKRIPVLEQIADGKKLDVVTASFEGGISWEHAPAGAGDRIKAIAELGRVGLGPAVRMEDVRERLQQTLSLLRAALPSATFDTLVPKLREVWR